MCAHPGLEESREVGAAAGKALATGAGAAAGAGDESAELSQPTMNAEIKSARQAYFMDTKQTCFAGADKDRFFAAESECWVIASSKSTRQGISCGCT